MESLGGKGRRNVKEEEMEQERETEQGEKKWKKDEDTEAALEYTEKRQIQT